MKRIDRLLIDSSSVVMACLFAAANGENSFITEFENKEDIVPSQVDGYEIFLSSLGKAMKDLDKVPSQIVLVKDGKNSRELRQKIFPPYKKRAAKNPAFLEQFNIMQDRVEEMLWSYGALSVVKDGYEADDLLAAMWQEGDWIWSKDGDLLAAGDWYYKGEKNPDKFLGIADKHIVVYKSLVGDKSDKIPGVKGFGKKAFEDMIIKYDDDVCDELIVMLENETLDELKEFMGDFKPFEKVVELAHKAYQCYYCAKFHHPGWDLNWQARFPETNGDLPRWNRTETLMGADTLDIPEIRKQLRKVKTGFVGLDIETYEDEESLEWGMANKPKNDKEGKLDVYGSHITGLSITCGENNQHVYYLPTDHKDTDNLTFEQLTDVLNLIPDGIDTVVHNALFELPLVRMHCELRHDRGWLPNVLDTQIEKSYVNENDLLSLKHCTKSHLKYDQVTYEEVTKGRRMNELTGEEVVSYGADDSVVTCALHVYFRAIMDYEGTSHAFDECEQWSAYMFAEAFVNGLTMNLDRLAELHKVNKKETDNQKAAIDLFLMNLEWEDDIEEGKVKHWPGCVYEPVVDLTPAEVKRAYLAYTGEKLTARVRTSLKMGNVIIDLGKRRFGQAVIDEDIEAINDLAGSTFRPEPILNLGSSPQKCTLLYEALGYPVRLYGKLSDAMRKAGRKKGNPKADEAALQMAVIFDAKSDAEKEFLKDILKAVELRTEESLYFNPYAKMPNPKDGMIHYGTGHSKTTSRRNAPNGPNVGQVSKKSPIREVYDPYDENSFWLSLDWSGQELRGTAWQSQCSEMLKCYPYDGVAKDLHSMTAVKIDNLKGGDLNYDRMLEALADEDNPDHARLVKLRKAAKPPAFGNVYGQTPIGLAMKQLISEEEAELMFNALFAAFPGVGVWKESRKKFFEENGYALTLLGARKHLELDGSWKDGHVYRSAGNFEIQGSAGEQMKVSCSKFWTRRIFERYPDAYFLFPVHDEMNFSVTKGEYVPKFIEEVHGVMCEQYSTQDLPVESSIEIGLNFGQLHDIGTKFDEEKVVDRINSL